ncbi:KaiC domain-containing protein [Halapricum sp. CBA1109]|uniref:KaiC domain-containing protein n=1 Tax=Halapricum sp. CBA1109 TaxID=2668068 RepID=UPI0012F89853|nr:KaiC domain-containing protein [Halapricum sp. CBA1109]MUV89943.1 KaiC domain-containing protein [Halapricum sp. CBA1109]
MSEDDSDDWFESAFEDEDNAPDESADDASDESDADAPDDTGGGDPFSNDASSSESPFDGEPAGESPFDDDGSGGESPFDDDGSGGESPFDDGEDALDDGEEGGSLFDDDFSSAMSSAGGGDGGGETDFDDENLDSDIPRIDLGIAGLDQMIHGGIPERHLIVSIGSPGTGKTTFGLQFLYHGLQQDQNAVFITLEQSREAILDTANERGWEFDRYEEEDKLAIVDLDPVEMANSLDNIRGEMPQLIREFDAERLVLDSVSLLEMMYDDQSKRRTEVFDFTRSLKSAGVTTMLTSEAAENNPYASRHGIIEYLTDAVFVLQYVRGDTQETRLAVEIQKIRNANHSRQTKPYEITLDGIDVYQQASIF